MTTAAPMLYLLTNDDDFDLLYQKLAAAFASNSIGLLQIRRKRLLSQPDGQALLESESQKIIELARRHHVSVVINDDVHLAAKLGVGVHLGQGDGSVLAARQLLGKDAIIGRTCHGDIDLVIKAKNDGATYAAMGAVFASTTKPNAATVSLDQLKKGATQGIDLCVIGGLNPENIDKLTSLPIRYVAVVSDILDLPCSQIGERCQQWQRALASF